jgi:hypothetical protein
MKLYATVASERASKSQGGNNYLHVSVTDEKREVVYIYIDRDGRMDIYNRITGEHTLTTGMEHREAIRRMGDIQEKEVEKFWLALRKNTMWRDSASGIVERHINELLATAIETAIIESEKGKKQKTA